VYFILVKENLASADRLGFIFGKLLREVVLPAFARKPSDVEAARKYGRNVLSALEQNPTMPPAAKDRID